MAKWFKTGGYSGFGDPIESVEVVKETEHTVTLAADKWRREHRAKKRGHECYFPTFDEAKAFLIAEAERQVESSKRQLAAASESWVKIRELTVDAVRERN